MEKNYKIYILYDKRLPVTNSGLHLYIGYTSLTLEQRLKSHITESKYSKSNTYKLNWIRQIGSENVGILLKEDKIPTLYEVIEREIFYIKQSKGCAYSGNYKILNGDDGGFGNTKNYSEEVLSKIRIALLGNNHYTKGIENTKKVNNYLKEHPNCNLSRNQILRILNKKLTISNCRKYGEDILINIFTLWNKEFYTTPQISKELNIPRNSVQSILHDSSYYKDIKDKNKLSAHKRGNHGGIKDPERIKEYMKIKLNIKD